MNVKALQRRFQLSLCRLLSSAAKRFIAQVGTEGYDGSKRGLGASGEMVDGGGTLFSDFGGDAEGGGRKE
jgi:hypothetical protein